MSEVGAGVPAVPTPPAPKPAPSPAYLATGAVARPAQPGERTPAGAATEGTGDARVDALVARLADVDGVPTTEHLAVYEDVHQGLRATLASLDETPAGGSNGRPDHRS
jgi:hypothetical protein